MRKFSLILISVTSAIVLCILIVRILQSIEQENDTFAKIEILPEFSFVDIKTGIEISKRHLTKEVKSLFIYFNTECEHCQIEISQLNKNIDYFNTIQIVMVSIEEPNVLLESLKHTSLLNTDNVFILFDSKNEFQKIFGNYPFPTSIIYNNDQKLVKVFKGEVKIEALLKYLNNNEH